MCASQPSSVGRQPAAGTRWPFSLTVTPVARMLNFELADHPVYDGAELQWFDDEVRGTGMLAFLSRRTDRRVDYYVEHGLTVDRAGYRIGGGTRSWNEIDFEAARLDVADDGVDADVRFLDTDGRLIEIRVLDRDGRRRGRTGLLAPVGAGIDDPSSLMLVWMPRFDLVRLTRTPPVIRIDGQDAATGRLPGASLHLRCLIKYAAPLVAVELNRDPDGVAPVPHEGVVEAAPAGRLTMLTTEQAGHRARLLLAPGVPELGSLEEGHVEDGRWRVEVDGVRLTGGGWSVTRRERDVQLAMDVDQRWQPERLPWLMRVVTTLVPVFRHWPTTYRWRCHVRLDETPTVTSRWERTVSGADRGYRRATGS